VPGLRFAEVSDIGQDAGATAQGPSGLAVYVAPPSWRPELAGAGSMGNVTYLLCMASAEHLIPRADGFCSARGICF